jgi:hypothetical protein
MAFLFKKPRSKEEGGNSPSVKENPPALPAGKKGGGKKNGRSGKIFARKWKGFRATSGNKYALIIGDEGAILIYITGKVVQSRNFIAHASADNLKEFETILSKDIKAPIFMIIDSMDQSFVQQTLPPISALGVKKLIKRRLDRDLGADVIKGYVLLERDSSGRRDWNFLMVSLENSPHLNLWFEFVERVDNRLKGIYLLSVEAENIVKNIDLAMGKFPEKDKKQEETSRWKFFITHNKVGGFRQVILRDGRIIFTRLTQPVGEVTPEVIAGNIEQEMSSTIEYMKRLAFNSQEGLDIYVIASSDINNYLDLLRVQARHIYKFTPFEAAEFFGITGAAQPSDQFGDVILSASIACSRNHRLVLSLPKSAKVNSFYNIMQYQRLGAGAVILCMILYSGFLVYGIWEKTIEIEDLEQKKNAQQRRLDDLNVEIKKSGIDVKKISDKVALYKQLNSENQSPLPLLSHLRDAIIPQVLIREVTWQGGESEGGNPMPPGGAPPMGAAGAGGETLSLVLRFPDISGTDEAFSAIARKVLKDVRAAFPEYRAFYTKLPDVLAKKTEAGEITFDDKDTVVEIDKAKLEATLTLTRQSEMPAAAMGGAARPPGLPMVSTDELIGLGKQ